MSSRLKTPLGQYIVGYRDRENNDDFVARVFDNYTLAFQFYVQHDDVSKMIYKVIRD